MKKTIIASILSLISLAIAAQESLITDGSFENQQVYGNNEIPRIAAFADYGSTSQTQNPAVEPAIEVARGVWYRKSPNSGYLKGFISQADKQDGDHSLLLSTDKNSGQPNLDQWFNNVLVQYVNIDRTKKYTIKLYAKANQNCEKIYVGLVSGKGGSVKGSGWINITSEWAEYSIEVQPSAHPDKGQFTNEEMNKACIAIGIAAQYGDNSKTIESSVFIDNVRMYIEK